MPQWKKLQRTSLVALLALALVAIVPVSANAQTTLTDDFDELSDHWLQAAGTWEAAGGAARVVTAGSERGSRLALVGYRMQESSSAQSTFRLDGGDDSAWGALTVHRAGLEDDYTESGYSVLVRNNGEVAVIAAAGSPDVRYLDSVQTSMRPGEDWVTLGVELSAGTMRVTAGPDAQEILSVTDIEFNDGGFSFAAHRDVLLEIDSVELDGLEEVDESVPVPTDCVLWTGDGQSGSRGEVLNSDERIAAVSERVGAGDQPQAAAFDRLLDEVQHDLLREPNPPQNFFVPFFYNNPDAHRAARDGLQTDANAAYRLALAYRITGEEQYAAHATTFLNSWTETVKCVRTIEDSALTFSYHFPAFIYAAELLRESGIWAQADERQFAGFVADVAGPVAEEIMHRTNNWGSWALTLRTAAASYLDDSAMLESSFTRGLELLEHQIDAAGHMPEEVTRNDGVGDYGIWYTHFSLFPLMLTAETLAGHGYDLHGYVNDNGASLEDGARAAAGWVADPESFEYFTGDVADLANVRTIDYLLEDGIRAHSMSYLELVANHYSIDDVQNLLAEEGAMTTIHSAPFLSLTHGALPASNLAPEPSQPEVLSVSPEQITVSDFARTGIEITAQGFAASAEIELRVEGGVVAQATSDDSGSVQFHYIHAGATPGALTLHLISGTDEAQAIVTVLADVESPALDGEEPGDTTPAAPDGDDPGGAAGPAPEHASDLPPALVQTGIASTLAVIGIFGLLMLLSGASLLRRRRTS